MEKNENFVFSIYINSSAMVFIGQIRRWNG